MTISLIKINKLYTGIIFLIINKTVTTTINNLSTIGSINFPKLVIKLNYLAIKPSKISVIPDSVKSIKAST